MKRGSQQSPSSTRAETPAEREARWAAESSATKPRSPLVDLVADLLPRALAGLIVLAFVAGAVFVGLDVANRGRGEGMQHAGWITAGTCFADNPDDYFADRELAGALPTVDCAQAHRAEAYLSLNLEVIDPDDVESECARGWAEESDIPTDVSDIRLTMLSKLDGQTETTVLCVAVGPEPVEGRQQLKHWDPRLPHNVVV